MILKQVRDAQKNKTDKLSIKGDITKSNNNHKFLKADEVSNTIKNDVEKSKCLIF